MTQIKTFSATYISGVQREANNWLAENEKSCKIISTLLCQEGELLHIMITYEI